jgi:hypothetical protein
LIIVIAINRAMLNVRPKRHGKAVMKMWASRIGLAWRTYGCGTLSKMSRYLQFTAECLGSSSGAERKNTRDDRYWVQKNGDVAGVVQKGQALLGLQRNARPTAAAADAARREMSSSSRTLIEGPCL